MYMYIYIMHTYINNYIYIIYIIIHICMSYMIIFYNTLRQTNI